MKDRFLQIKSLGVIGDAWLVNNKGEQIHTQLSGKLNRKMVQDITTRMLQLLALQGIYVGPESSHVMLQCDDLIMFAFDLGHLVLIAIAQMSGGMDASQLLSELDTIAQDFRQDTKFLAKYERKGVERRDLITDGYLDEKARNLIGELRKATF